jgi:hypothetical protein
MSEARLDKLHLRKRRGVDTVLNGHFNGTNGGKSSRAPGGVDTGRQEDLEEDRLAGGAGDRSR